MWADDDVKGLIEDLMTSPVPKCAWCNPTNFSFNPNSVIIAKLNRAELGGFDALVLGFFLMAQFRGQVIVQDFGRPRDACELDAKKPPYRRRQLLGRA